MYITITFLILLVLNFICVNAFFGILNRKYSIKTIKMMDNYQNSPDSTINMEKRKFKSIGLTTATILVSSLIKSPSNAFDLFPSKEQVSINNIADYRKIVDELVFMLTPNQQANAVGTYASVQLLKDSKEDCDVVATYLNTKFKPLQIKMKDIASKLNLPDEKQTRIELLPNLMLGHTLELSQAIKSKSSKEELKEVLEIKQTLEEFLVLASTKYNVNDLKLDGAPLPLPLYVKGKGFLKIDEKNE